MIMQLSMSIGVTIAGMRCCGRLANSISGIDSSATHHASWRTPVMYGGYYRATGDNFCPRAERYIVKTWSFHGVKGVS